MANKNYTWGLEPDEVVTDHLNALHIGRVRKDGGPIDYKFIRGAIKGGAAYVNAVLCKYCIPLDCKQVEPSTTQIVRDMIGTYVNYKALLKVGAPNSIITEAEKDWQNRILLASNDKNYFGCEPERCPPNEPHKKESSKQCCEGPSSGHGHNPYDFSKGDCW